MNPSSDPDQALRGALTRLLRPLVRPLLRHGVPYAAFADLAKQAWVEVAMKDFALAGRRPSLSRASIFTGLTRKEVQRRVAEPLAPGEAPVERHNRTARVLTAWVRDAGFLGPDGARRALAADGELGFAALARRHSGDMPARAVRDELPPIGAVRQRGDGLLEPVARGYVPQRSPVDVLPTFRRWSATFAQALLEKLDRWLATRDAAAVDAHAPRARVGVGICYFEETPAPVPAGSDT